MDITHSIIETQSWNPKDIDQFFHLCSFLKDNPRIYEQDLKGRILINAFFEPSTRTSLSFESAMKKLGGEVITFHGTSSSLQKGESNMDTMKCLSQYGDAIVLRHSSADFIYEVDREPHMIPLLNAGNGDKEHPSQALLDLYTLYKTFGREYKSKPLHILFIGDIKHSRTIHSFLKLLHLYPQMKIYFLPYSGCEPEPSFVQKIASIHNQVEDEMVLEYYNDETSSYIETHPFDVVYLTRLQKERHDTKEEEIPEPSLDTSMDTSMDISMDTTSDTTSENDSNHEEPYHFTNEDANKLHQGAIIMHPLPRNKELDVSVDTNPRARYYQQMEYGVEVRMGLLIQILIPKSKRALRIEKYTKIKDTLDKIMIPSLEKDTHNHVVILFLVSTITIFSYVIYKDYCNYLSSLHI